MPSELNEAETEVKSKENGAMSKAINKNTARAPCTAGAKTSGAQSRNPHVSTFVTLHPALRRMAGLVFLLAFWVLAGPCQRHGVGGFESCNSPCPVSTFQRHLAGI